MYIACIHIRNFFDTNDEDYRNIDTVKPILRDPPHKQPPSYNSLENQAHNGHLTCKMTFFEWPPVSIHGFSVAFIAAFQKRLYSMTRPL